VSRALPTTTMRFGAFPSSDDYQLRRRQQCTAGLPADETPQRSFRRRFEQVDAIVSYSGHVFAPWQQDRSHLHT